MDKNIDLTGATWMTPPSSLEQNCVEFAVVDGGVGVRDSKNREGGTLTFTHAEWDVFKQDVRDGKI